jgi:non-heme chloroperoxidase
MSQMSAVLPGILLMVLSIAAPAHAAIQGNECSPSVSTLQAERSHYRQRFVSVADDVKLEVLDWGGSGRPLVLLAGLGNSAHVFDMIAPELAWHFHVYGITRRGFGASSAPKTGYTPEQLSDDVMAVLRALDIQRPIVVGHSIAGEELSAIGNRFPDRVAGLIYLDAAHEYAVYDPQRGGYLPDLNQLSKQIASMHADPLDRQQMIALLNDTSALQRSLTGEIHAVSLDHASADGASPAAPSAATMADFAAFRCFVSAQVGGLLPEDEIRHTFTETATGGVGDQKSPDFVSTAILEHEERFQAPNVPILSIVPVPRASDLPIGSDPAKRQAAETLHTQSQEAEIAALLHQRPSAKIVRIPHGHHFIFLSNQSEIVSAIDAFGSGLP